MIRQLLRSLFCCMPDVHDNQISQRCAVLISAHQKSKQFDRRQGGTGVLSAEEEQEMQDRIAEADRRAR